MTKNATARHCLALSTWRDVTAQRQSEKERIIQEWSERILGTPIPLMPHLTVTNVVEWPYKSGQLSARQIEITDSEPSQLLKMLASGAWTAQEVLLAFIARCIIAHHLTNPLTDPMFDQGFRRAVELDDYHRRTGKTVGPFHGLPISLKDVFNIQGMPTTLGFVARANAHPLHSDELVNRLSAAGAIFYCKTNIPQSLMSGECHNFLFGRTATPYNTTLSAGGSSGGEGSLIALGGSPLGIGSDIAGSIRTPANFNGIYGLCPTNGRFPLHDAEQSNAGYLINGVAGPLSKSIDGLEVYARTLLSLKPWEWDSACERLPWDEQVYQETLLIGLSGKRQLCIGFVANDGIATPHPPIQRGMRETRAALEKAGVQVVDVQLFDGTEGMWEMITRIFNADGGKAFREEIAKSGEPISEDIELANPQDAMSVRQLLDHGKKILKIRQNILSRWQRTSSLTATGRPVDMFVLPSGCHVASPHGTMKYWLYEAISNILDWTCATIPVGHVDLLKDPKPGNGGDFKPLSSLDRDNWNLYSPELYSDAPICLQDSLPMTLAMATNVVVITDAGTLAPEIKDEIGAYSDIVGSRSDVNAPIVAGIWDLFDRKTPTESFTAEWDEMKYIVKGTAVITDTVTNQSYELKPGSLLWIPKGSRASFTKSKGLSTIYVEQRHGEGNFKTGSEAKASCDLRSKLATLIDNFVAENPSSLAAHKRAQETLAGGNTRSVLHGDPFALYMEGGQGPYLYSVDKREYLDFVSDYSAAFYGHSNPAIAEAISSALSTGFSLGSVTRKECHLGERIKRRFPSMERVRFCNSGTEANTCALVTATEFTGRTKILVFDNGYHDGTLNFGSGDNKLNFPHDFIFGTYNNIEANQKHISSDLAAIIVEPMLSAGGQIPATREFLSFLRKTADVTGAVLIFDEVVTSRLHINGLQGFHKIMPDMTTLGQYIGGGLPFGALGGRSDIMALYETRTQKLSHSGTFNNNVFTISAALAAIELVSEDEIHRVNKLGDTIRNKISEICAAHHLSDLRITGFGSAIGLQFLREDRDLLKGLFFYYMLQHGICIGRRGFLFLNMCHTEDHVQRFLTAFQKFVEEFK
ncbi:hypothetical protein FocTR4_00000970 [Fusarium oxysporum f. sp. cubense]|uniref:amidase n=1 Tax=Fusarium oxysporum f. sp. cubense TaxID=61366 RepID=A0A5C6SZ96_FUSOC|nr:hypothetical protein FocTR4_00000970 [Fusarium oxysporum f. sp. cubense]